jgi:16S rRNA processing protein RimM
LGDRRRFPPLPPGEYYWFQVLGLPVVNEEDGARLGYLDHIIPTPGHDVYVVRDGEREILLPAVEDVIVEINLKEGVIKALPPEGLL